MIASQCWPPIGGPACAPPTSEARPGAGGGRGASWNFEAFTLPAPFRAPRQRGGPRRVARSGSAVRSGRNWSDGHRLNEVETPVSLRLVGELDPGLGHIDQDRLRAGFEGFVGQPQTFLRVLAIVVGSTQASNLRRYAT